MRTRLSLCFLACLAIQGGSDADSQSLVRLDIQAMRDGVPVRDLAASDIDLSESGTTQHIDELKHVSTAARSFVVFLDTPHMRFEGVRAVRGSLGTLLDHLLDDDDLVALVTPDIALDQLAFTTKQSVISGPLQDEATWDRTRAGSRDAKEDRYAQCFPANQYRNVSSEMQERHREQLTLDAVARLISRLSTREERTAVILVTDGWKLAGPNPRLGQGEAGGQRGPGPGAGGSGGRGGFPQGGGGRGRAGGRGGDSDAGGRSIDDASRAECDTDRITLATADNALRLDRLADAANRGMISFYPVLARLLAPDQTAGGRSVPTDDVESDPESRIDSMRQLSTNTNGLAVLTNSGLETIAARIAGDMNAYDVVTYRSSNTSLDGRFRALTVRSLRPGVVVRTRRGYRGSTVEDLVGSRDASATSVGSAISALTSASARTSLLLRTAFARTGDNPDATLWVVGELDYRVRRELAWTAGAVADVTVIAADGHEISSQTIELPTVEAFQVKVSEGGGLVAGEYAVRVRLRPNNDGGRPLTDTARVVVPNTLPVTGDGLLWRRGPSTGPRFVLTADARFLRSERIRVELPTRSAAPAAARMLDRLGNPNQVPVQVSERVDGDGLRWIAGEAVLAALAPGDYAIEITVEGVKRVTAFQLVP
jgi:VWFA-related protein